eukprot:5038767-Pleurochrysis_carterae.AAC.2
MAPAEGRKLIQSDTFLLDHFKGLAAAGRKRPLVEPAPAPLPDGVRVDTQRVQHHRQARRAAKRGLHLRDELLRQRKIGLRGTGRSRLQKTRLALR